MPRTMVMILGGNSEKEKKYPNCPALDLIKCLKQIQYQGLLLTCSPISELPCNMSTLPRTKAYIRLEEEIGVNSGALQGVKLV